MSKIIEAHPLIQEKWPLIKADYEKAMPGYTLIITEAYRSPERQKELYNKGRTLPGPKVTNVDGYKIIGAHNYNPARAIDVAVKMVGGTVTLWDEKLYYPLVDIAKKYGVESGGGWKSFKDWPHLQCPNFASNDWAS